MKKTNQYYVGITPDENIWGIGLSEDGALNDAKDNLGLYSLWYPDEPKYKSVIVVECTKRLYDDISHHGYCAEDENGGIDHYWYYGFGYADLIIPPKRLNQFKLIRKHTLIKLKKL